MRRVMASISIIMMITVCVGITGCTSNAENVNTTQTQAEKPIVDSRNPYTEMVTDATYIYDLLLSLSDNDVQLIADDVIAAWRCAIDNEDEVRSGGAEYLSSCTSLSEEELKELADKMDYYNQLSSACVYTVLEAYELSGKLEEIEAKFETAKQGIGQFGKDYTDEEDSHDLEPKLQELYENIWNKYMKVINPEGSILEFSENMVVNNQAVGESSLMASRTVDVYESYAPLYWTYGGKLLE